MALSNPAPNAMSRESETRASLRPASPVVSGFTAYGSVVPKVRTPAHSQQQYPTLPRQSMNFEVPQLQRASVIEGGKEATTHDFLSLYGVKSASLSETTATRGLASSVTTQNLLTPLEKGSGLSSRGLETGANVTSQESSYTLVNGTLDLPSHVLYRVDRGDFVPGRLQEDVSEIPRQWATSDTSQKLEGKNNDSKESTPKSTPRSKHSAMEQRRRTKINDRFQMLRQLVPNVDQKRDKASFLLEVIDYVKLLQEKARKYEAAEQSRQQQDRLKPALWDVCQRNPGCRDSSADSSHIPLVPTVSFETRKVSDSNGYMNPLPATRENDISGAELMSSMVQAVALSDGPARGPQAPHSSSDNKVVTSRIMSVTSPAQTPAVSVPESSSCTHFVPRGTPEPKAMFGPLHHRDKQTAIPFMEAKVSTYKRVEVVTVPQLGKNKQSPSESLTNVSDLNCERDMTSEKSLQNSKQGKLNEESDSLKSSQVSDHCSKEMGLGLNELEKDDSRAAIDVNGSKGKQKSRARVDEQTDKKEPLTVHGGVINVSSLYSQGLLDTLTRALRSSGLDLTKATISVQIDLGRPGTEGVATSPRKVTSQTTEIGKESGSSPELEHPAKRSKIEVDV